MRTVAFFAIVTAVGAQSLPTPAELVRRLGSPQFAAREDAQRKLAALGATALPAVEAGLADENPEVARRCKDLVPTLKRSAAVKASDAIREGKVPAGTPLWESFRAICGEEREARNLFADLYLSSPQLLEEADADARRGDGDGVAKAFRLAARSAQEDFNRILTPTRDQALLPPDFADRLTALLLAGTVPGADPSDEVWQTVVARTLLTTLEFRARLTGKDERGVATRKLLAAFCKTAKSEVAITGALRQAMLYDLRDVAPDLARRGLALKAKSLITTATAIEALGRYGAADQDVRRIVPLLGIEEEAHPGPPTGVATEIGDVALLALVRLTGQRPADYRINEVALELSIGAVFAPRGGLLQALRCPIPGFATAADREEGFRKWRQWAEAHPDVSGYTKPTETPYDPKTAMADAKRQALGKVVSGRRLRNQLAFGRGNPLALSVGIRDGKPVFGETTFNGVQINGSGSLGRSGVSPVGPAFGQVVFTNGQPEVIFVEAVDDAAADRLFVTSIGERPGGSFKLTYSDRTLAETVTTRLESADKVTLVVRRVRNADGKVLSDATIEADSMVALRKKNPKLFAEGLEPVLKKLGCEVPAP